MLDSRPDPNITSVNIFSRLNFIDYAIGQNSHLYLFRKINVKGRNNWCLSLMQLEYGYPYLPFSSECEHNAARNSNQSKKGGLGGDLSLLIRRVIRFTAFSSSFIFTSFRKFLLSTAYIPPFFLPPLIFFCWLLIMVLLTLMVIKITYLFYGLLFTFHILFYILEESIHRFYFVCVCGLCSWRRGRGREKFCFQLLQAKSSMIQNKDFQIV